MPTLKTIDYSVLQQCMHCGMCLPTCPTYDATKRERNSPRGRIALMRAIADGELEVTKTFADEMSYCLGCLACQTACPAGVNYAMLFETARSDIERSQRQRRRAAGVLASGDARLPVSAAAALRLAGRLMRLYQRSGIQAAGTDVRADALPAARRCARLEPQAPRIGRGVLEPADRAQRNAARSDAVQRRAADRLHAGSRLRRRQPRHGRRPARQRLRRRDARAAAVLRLAACPQRRARPRRASRRGGCST